MTDWIEHDGSGMPVPGDTLVYARHSNGFDDSFCKNPTQADYWHEEGYGSSWVNYSNDEPYITSYKVVTA